MKTQLKVCHNRPSDAYEIQTNETPVRLVAAIFHRDNGNPGRLMLDEAAQYANLFAAAPALLERTKIALEICFAMADAEHCLHEATKNSSPAAWAERCEFFKAAIALAEKES